MSAQLTGDATDGLVAEIAEHCQRDRAGYDATAREWTRRYAMDGDVAKQETKPSSSSHDGTDDDSSDDDSREGAPSVRHVIVPSV